MTIPRPVSLEKLLALLRELPTVGPKLSERIAFHLLRMGEPDIQNLVQTIQETHRQVRPCDICGYWDDRSPCRICSDISRDSSLLCVVENSQDLVAFSRVRDFNGLFFVLGGVLSPLDGIGPQDLRISPLLEQLERGTVREVILALNPDMEGEITSDYIAKQILLFEKKKKDSQPDQKFFQVRISRLAQGLPVGSEIEYADEITLSRSFDQRKELAVNGTGEKNQNAAD